MSLHPSGTTVAGRRGKSSVPISSSHLPASPPMTPMSPTLMSPPMTAKSFGTFIDSAPSTPAYSPHPSSGWDGSALMLLSPVSNVSTTPSSPPEPEWDMLAPVKTDVKKERRKQPVPLPRGAGGKYVEWKGAGTALSSHHVPSIREEPRREYRSRPSEEEDKADGNSPSEGTKEERQASPSAVAPLERIATRVKSILRRKPVGDRKSSEWSSSEKKLEKERKRRKYQDLDYMEDVHWTEM